MLFLSFFFFKHVNASIFFFATGLCVLKHLDEILEIFLGWYLIIFILKGWQMFLALKENKTRKKKKKVGIKDEQKLKKKK